MPTKLSNAGLGSSLVAVNRMGRSVIDPAQGALLHRHRTGVEGHLWRVPI